MELCLRKASAAAMSAAAAESQASAGSMDPRPPPASCPMPHFLRRVEGERPQQQPALSDSAASDTELEGSEGGALEESVEELLSGPKDSVMMFTKGSAGSSRKCKWLQFQHSAEGDPLDLLAKEFQAQHQQPGMERPSSARPSCVPSAAISHSQELAYRCRNALHRELDAFFHEAAGCSLDGEAGRGLSRAARAEEGAGGDGGRAEQAGCWVTRARLDEYKQAAAEARMLRERVDALESEHRTLRESQQEAVRNREESVAALRAARQEIEILSAEVSILDRQALHAEKSGAELQAARSELKGLREKADALQLQVRGLHGDRSALEVLPGGELARLAEVLTEALGRVNREQVRRVERQRDEQLCVACLSEKKNVVLQPCKHLTLCEGCFQKCNSACPQCRTLVRGHLVIYT